MTRCPRVTDNDNGEIRVTLDGQELRGWSYRGDDERRAKMVQAREYVEGWCDGRAGFFLEIKNRTDLRLDRYLCEMKPGYDDSITGFNEAWDVMRRMFGESADVTR